MGRGDSIEFHNPKTDTFCGVKIKGPQSGKSSDRHVNHLLWDSGKTLWAAYENGQLYRYRPSDTQATSFTTVARYVHRRGDKRALSGTILNGLADDGHGSLWVASWDGGVCRIALQSGEVEQLFHNPSAPSSLPGGGMMDIACDRTGAVWVGIHGSGLLCITPPRAESRSYDYRLYNHDPETPQSLSDNRVRAIYFDRSGLLWTGTESGLNTSVPLPGFIHVEIPRQERARGRTTGRGYADLRPGHRHARRSWGQSVARLTRFQRIRHRKRFNLDNSGYRHFSQSSRALSGQSRNLRQFEERPNCDPVRGPAAKPVGG